MTSVQYGYDSKRSSGEPLNVVFSQHCWWNRGGGLHTRGSAARTHKLRRLLAQEGAPFKDSKVAAAPPVEPLPLLIGTAEQAV